MGVSDEPLDPSGHCWPVPRDPSREFQTDLQTSARTIPIFVFFFFSIALLPQSILIDPEEDSKKKIAIPMKSVMERIASTMTTMAGS